MPHAPEVPVPAAAAVPARGHWRRLAARLHPATSLRNRFAWLIGTSGLALALVLVAVVDRAQRRQVLDLQGRAMGREAQLLRGSLTSVLAQRLQQLQDTAAHPLLGSGQVDPGDTRLLLESLRAQQPAFAWIALLDPQGRVQVATGALLEGSEAADDPVLRAALRAPWVGGRRPAGPLTGSVGLVGGKPPALIDLGVPVVDIKGRAAGAIVARLRWDWLDDLHRALAAPVTQLADSQVLVLDRDGRVLLGPPDLLDHPLPTPLPADAAPQVLRWADGGEFLTAWDRAPAQGAVRLGVVVRQPRALAFLAADALHRQLLLLTALGTVVFIGLSAWLASRVARPIQELSSAAWRVLNHQPPQFAAIAKRRRDEVAQVAGALRALHGELSRRLADQQRAAARYETLFAHAPVALCVLVAGRVRIANHACAQLFGLADAQALLDRPSQALLHPDDRTRLAIDAAPGAAQATRLDLRILRDDGSTADVEATAMPLTLDDAAGVLLALRDVTAEHQAKALLRDLNQQLEQRVAARTVELTAANAELDAFAYAVSHDLRGPLRAMRGFAQAALEDHGSRLDAAAQEDLQHIVAGAQRMGELIDGLLALSRSVRGEIHGDVVDLGELAGAALAVLRRGDPGRHVEVAIERGLWVQGDRRMLAAVMANLVGNAWKYSAGRPDARIAVQAEPRDGQRWICVRDNGAGFDMLHAARLFQPFARLHRQDEFEGLGIGLATVKRIVMRHGGRIEAEARPGQGACFRLLLPAPPAPHEDPPCATTTT